MGDVTFIRARALFCRSLELVFLFCGSISRAEA